MHRAEVGDVGGEQPTQPAILPQQARGQLKHILARRADAQDDRQQLGGLEGRRAVALQPLARALVRGHLAHRVSILDAAAGIRHDRPPLRCGLV